MKYKIIPNYDGYEPADDYFNEKDSYEIETDEYFPLETSKPPHY